jgi:2-C-methyl-D-erythritol 4-phosphate cytidylyltransferase
MKIAAIITSAGRGARFSAKGNKLFHKVNGKFLLQYTVDAFVANRQISEVIVTYAPADLLLINQLDFGEKANLLVEGGATRTQSVWNGIKALSADTDYVLIHDGARPFVSQKIIDDCISTARKHKSAVCATPIYDTLKLVTGSQTVGDLNRDQIYAIQTPQGYAYDRISLAYRELNGSVYTDDSTVYSEKFGPATIFPGSKSNLKITTKEDLVYFDLFGKEKK